MQKNLLTSLLILILVVSFQNCGPNDSSDGTDTGSAMSPDDFSSTISSRLCQRIAACQPAVQLSSCETAAESQIFNVSQIGSACMDAIEALPCNHPQVMNAYDPVTGSFSGVSALVSSVPSCKP